MCLFCLFPFKKKLVFFLAPSFKEFVIVAQDNAIINQSYQISCIIIDHVYSHEYFNKFRLRSAVNYGDKCRLLSRSTELVVTTGYSCCVAESVQHCLPTWVDSLC